VRLVGAPERRRPDVDLPTAPSALGALFGALALLLVGYVIWLAVQPHYHYSPVVDGWALDGFEVVVALVCGARALVRRPGRGAALALGVGLLSWSVGDIVFTVQTLSKATPYGPTLSDLFWLGFYPPAYVGVVLFMRREVRRIADPSWLDGLVASLGAASVCAAFAFAGLQLAGESALSATTDIAYPLGDLLLFALVVGGVTLLTGRKSAPWLLLAGAMALNAVGDTFNLFQSSLGTPRADAVFRALAWPAAGLLVCVAVWLRPRSREFLAMRRPAGFALPGSAAAAALAVLVVGTFHHVTPVALALAGATMLAVGVRVTLSARRLRELTMERFEQSLTDHLTGLRNRRYLMEILGSVFGDEAELTARGRLAFLYIDLDRFKAVNDSFGHAAGDELLKQLGPRLSLVLRHGEVVVRLGGDEFGVLLVGADAEDAATVARRLIDDIERPFDLEGLQARVSASIGIAYAPDDAGEGQELVRCADVAMYRAKQGDSSFALYDNDLDGEGNPWRLTDELRNAIDRGQLELHYQPQLDLRRGAFSAVEALVRWPHPRLGMVPPTSFVPLAEEAGLMPALTTWVLETGLDQCATWRDSGADVSVSVNVSPTNLLAPGFVDQVRSALAARRLPAEALVLEITETSIIANLEHAKRAVRELRDIGVVVSIDDFGAGFTSLAYLGDLAVGELKLDGAFIAGLGSPDSDRDADLVRATIELGHTMGLRVVAECIEDQPTLDLLRDLGCDFGQGYLISRPMPPDRLSLGSERLEEAGASRAG